MEKDQSHMIERILDLALEIIYLLTGEDCEVVKKISGELLTLNGCLYGTSPIIMPQPHSPTTEVGSVKSVLEVIKKMMELLTGEVPIRCQDITVYFSMEEWEYLEGHKELYKDVVMEDHTIQQHSQSGSLTDFNVIVKEEVSEEIFEDYESKELEFSERHKELHKDVMMESQPTLTSSDGSSNESPPERCLRPLYSQWASKQEDLTIPHHLQCEDIKEIQIEDEMEDETWVIEDQHAMEDSDKIMETKQEESVSADTNGRFARKRNTSEVHWMLSPGYNAEDNDITQCSPEENPVNNNRHHRADHTERSMDPSHPEESSHTSHTVTPNIHLQCQSAESSADPSNTKESTHTGTSASENNQPKHQRIGEMAKHPFPCLDCGKRFAQKGGLLVHQRLHTGERLHSCPECGKSFIEKRSLLKHQRSHTGERPYSCSECGKCFAGNGNLLQHLKIHRGERPYACSECGKCFVEKGNLLRHQKIHMAEQPFSCSHCGKCFSQKVSLQRHHRSHTGERPFSCAECGKSFTEKATLLKHQRSHTGERPYSCSECGKCFAALGTLIAHKRSHTGERPYSCSVCTKSFASKRNLIRHLTTHATSTITDA